MRRSFRGAAGLLLSFVNTAAWAETCVLARGTFQPRQSDDFALEPLAGGTVPRWQLRIRPTGETLTVRLERDGKGTWLIGDGEWDAPLRVPVRLLDADSRATANENAIGHLGFDDFWRLFAEHRIRSGLQPGSASNPPAGVWELTACAGERSPSQ